MPMHRGFFVLIAYCLSLRLFFPCWIKPPSSKILITNWGRIQVSGFILIPPLAGERIKRIERMKLFLILLKPQQWFDEPQNRMVRGMLHTVAG